MLHCTKVCKAYATVLGALRSEWRLRAQTSQMPHLAPIAAKRQEADIGAVQSRSIMIAQSGEADSGDAPQNRSTPTISAYKSFRESGKAHRRRNTVEP